MIYGVQEYGVTVQKFRMATNQEEAARIPGEFPCTEYVIKAQAGLYPPLTTIETCQYYY